jgi:hypothetical protein
VLHRCNESTKKRGFVILVLDSELILKEKVKVHVLCTIHYVLCIENVLYP